MDQVYLFSLAARQADWLGARHAAIAGNVANVNTPGYKARDVEPFSKILDETHLQMKADQPNHLNGGWGISAQRPGTRPEDIWETVHSGNTVSVEQEMLKAGEVVQQSKLNNSIVKAFHRMVLATVRG